MPKHCNLAKNRVFTKDRNAYICITQQFSVMIIDNKYTTKHPCIAANYNMYQPHTGKREHRERHEPAKLKHRAEQTYSNVVKQVN